MSYGSRMTNQEYANRMAVDKYTSNVDERDAVVAFLRKPSEYGEPCSADREVLAQQIERGEHLK
jgi:hypothetical protein